MRPGDLGLGDDYGAVVAAQDRLEDVLGRPHAKDRSEAEAIARSGAAELVTELLDFRMTLEDGAFHVWQLCAIGHQECSTGASRGVRCWRARDCWAFGKHAFGVLSCERSVAPC